MGLITRLARQTFCQKNAADAFKSRAESSHIPECQPPAESPFGSSRRKATYVPLKSSRSEDGRMCRTHILWRSKCANLTTRGEVCRVFVRCRWGRI